MSHRRIPGEMILIVQLIVLGAFLGSFALAKPATQKLILHEVAGTSAAETVSIPRQKALTIEPLYDDPSVVTEEELAAVLAQIVPRFPKDKLKPNYVEHALRTWWLEAEFSDPSVMSGAAMKDYLVDHGKYLASWGPDVDPLLEDRTNGVAIRWGKETGASVHHDHWLACLTEAGVSLSEPVFTPNRRDRQIGDVLQEALRDFRLDEVETEWSSLAFALWMAPEKSWTNRSGRQLDFDLMVDRLIRGDMKLGVCAGTHRVYSLMALVRLDDDHKILSPKARDAAWKHLETVRDRIKVSQFPDGHWPSNWPDGAAAVTNPVEDELYKQVIATGHHLEWLSIAPLELHPPREQVRKAARWVIDTTIRQTPEDIGQRYTFFSHVGNSLCLWRKTHPAVFFKAWEASHPGWLDAPASALVPANVIPGE